MIRRRLWWLALLPAVVATGCGFHLRGASHLPPAFQLTYIDSTDHYTDFHRALGEALSASGNRVVARAEDAGATVEVLRDDTGQRVLSVSATNVPTEYDVYYTVRYRVRIGTREALPPQTLTLTRDYSFLETAALAKEQEQEIIRAALARDLAALIMRRLAALPP
ncbi:MAG TPA: LPS assembly lipoprotein LptE [Steroidobacteraceae bacterium]|nr:LPS assembly lipoprotein LptE [Steroidobacteraceae bacterium]